MQSLYAKATVLTLDVAFAASTGAGSDVFSYRQVVDLLYKVTLANRTAYASLVGVVAVGIGTALSLVSTQMNIALSTVAVLAS